MKTVLYRCKTPTDVLCPCGAVARRLERLGIDYRTERVPHMKRYRPEIVELTGQTRVPVLVDSEEVVHDSKRILQYLDHAYGNNQDSQGGREEGRKDGSKRSVRADR